MSDKIKYIKTKLHIPVENVVNGIDPNAYNDILIIGFNEDGDLLSASSTGDVGELLYIIEAFKLALLSGDFEK